MTLRQGAERKITGLRENALLAVIGLLLLITSCTPPPPPASLHEALRQETGYQLGEDRLADAIKGAECAAESRYDGARGPVLLLICVAPLDESARRIRYRINYTPPEAGHRIWKISASVPDATFKNLDILSKLEKKYGPPRKWAGGHTLRWETGAAYLEIRQDRYGVQFSLWDRSLRQS